MTLIFSLLASSSVLTLGKRTQLIIKAYSKGPHLAWELGEKPLKIGDMSVSLPAFQVGALGNLDCPAAALAVTTGYSGAVHQ